MSDAPENRRGTAPRPIADEDPLLDHHVEELLAALNDLADPHTADPSDRENRP